MILLRHATFSILISISTYRSDNYIIYLLFFWKFQPCVAYESVAYKKACTFSLVPDPAECTKNIVTKEFSKLPVLLKIKLKIKIAQIKVSNIRK